MDFVFLCSRFSEFWGEIKPAIVAISELSNTYGSFRRVPLSKFVPYHTMLYLAYQKHKSLYIDISYFLNNLSTYSGKETYKYKQQLKEMLIVLNSVFILLNYFGYEVK